MFLQEELAGSVQFSFICTAPFTITLSVFTEAEAQSGALTLAQRHGEKKKKLPFNRKKP